MAGVEMSEEITNDQLEAMSGGELLRQEVCRNKGFYRQSQKFLIQKSQNGVLNKRILNFVYKMHPLLPSSQIYIAHILKLCTCYYGFAWFSFISIFPHLGNCCFFFSEIFVWKIVPIFVFNPETFCTTLPFESLIHFIILQWTERWLLNMMKVNLI